MISRKTALFFISLFLFIAVVELRAQEKTPVVELRGIVLDETSALPIPNVTIKNLNTRISTLSDSLGRFVMAVLPGDTVVFEAMTYEPDFYVVPRDVEDDLLGFVEVMRRDIHVLEEVTVRPFPTQMQFEQAFLSVNPDEITDKTIRLNMQLEEVTDDPTNMQHYILNYSRHYAVYVITGDAPPNNFLHPERWMEFIQAWQEGRFTEEAVEKLDDFPPATPIEDPAANPLEY